MGYSILKIVPKPIESTEKNKVIELPPKIILVFVFSFGLEEILIFWASIMSEEMIDVNAKNVVILMIWLIPNTSFSPP